MLNSVKRLGFRVLRVSPVEGHLSLKRLPLVLRITVSLNLNAGLPSLSLNHRKRISGFYLRF